MVENKDDLNCSTCVYSEVIVKKGDDYTVLNPFGEESTRKHTDTVLICRLVPPMNGWPQVSEEDWCGQYSAG